MQRIDVLRRDRADSTSWRFPMSLHRLVPVSLVLPLLAPSLAAGILTVGPAGSGAQFTEIQAAVDAALDGDVILVRPGTYAAIVVEKPLRILGDGTGTVRIEAPTESAVSIRGIAASEELVLSGVEAVSNRTVIHVQDCPGTVVLQGLVVSLASDTGIELEDCGRALVLDSRIQAGSVERGLGAVFARNSEVWIANTDITGVTIPVIFAHYFFTTSALDVARSRLHVWRSRIRGGDGHPALKASADGGAGIRATHSSVDVFGGPDSTVAGGQGVGPQASGISHGGIGLELHENSHARLQGDVLIQGGGEGPGGPIAPPVQVDATSSVTSEAEVFPSLASSAAQVALGSSFSLDLAGNAFGFQVLYLSLRTGPTKIYPNTEGFGLLVLDRAQLVRITGEVLPTTGTSTVNFRVPTTPALLGSTLFFQSAEAFGGSFAISNPELVTITR